MLGLRLETPREASVILIFHVVGHGRWSCSRLRLEAGSIPRRLCCASAACRSSLASCMPRSAAISLESGATSTSASAIPAGLDDLAAGGRHLRQLLRTSLGCGHPLAAARHDGAAVLALPDMRSDPSTAYRSMPLLVGFGLVALFIWLAENIGTLRRTLGPIPASPTAWHMVPLTKFGSWYLLMIISFVLVSLVSPAREPDVSTADKRPVPRPKPVRRGW